MVILDLSDTIIIVHMYAPHSIILFGKKKLHAPHSIILFGKKKFQVTQFSLYLSILYHTYKASVHYGYGGSLKCISWTRNLQCYGICAKTHLLTHSPIHSSLTYSLLTHSIHSLTHNSFTQSLLLPDKHIERQAQQKKINQIHTMFFNWVYPGHCLVS